MMARAAIDPKMMGIMMTPPFTINEKSTFFLL
jgi:hypothetical protein